MSPILRSGKELVAALEQRAYFDRRRKAVDDGWATYMIEALERTEQGKEDPVRYGFDTLNGQTDAYIRREAQRWARSCQKYRIYEDDFESHFRFTVAKAALRYDGQKGTFFDYLRVSIRNAGRDLVRRALTKKNRINHLALSIEDEVVMREIERRYVAPSAEDVAVSRLVIEEMASDPTLTEQELAVFEFLRGDPDATLQEIADGVGLPDRKQAQRVKQRLARKLRVYVEEGLR